MSSILGAVVGVEIPLGSQTRQTALDTIKGLYARCLADGGEFPVGRLSEGGTQIAIRGDEVRIEQVVIYEVRCNSGFGDMYERHVAAVAKELKKAGFDCNPDHVWVSDPPKRPSLMDSGSSIGRG